MRVLWPHNFDPQKPNAGVFMHIAAKGIQRLGVDVNLEYLGNLRNPLEVLKARNRLQKTANQYDLIHSQFGSACAFATAGVKGVPKVLSVRGSDWNTYNGTNQFYYWHTRMARLLTKQSISRFDIVVTVSERTRKEINDIYPDTRSVSIPDPVCLKNFYPKNKNELRKKLNNESLDQKWVLFNSNVLNNPIKRYELARQAVELAALKDDKIRMKIANNIPHTEIPDFVASCDLILCTSTAEGWPNSIKEALACNIPFVATDVSDLPDIAAKEPVCKICPPDSELLAEAILDSLSQPYDYNLRKYVEDMEVEKASKKLLGLYEELLQK